MSAKQIIQILRDQAWSRAKGELESLLDTYYDDKDSFEISDVLIRDFIKEFEENM